MNINFGDGYAFASQQKQQKPILNLGTQVVSIPTPALIIPSVFVQVSQPVNIGLTASTPAVFSQVLPSVLMAQAQAQAQAQAAQAAKVAQAQGASSAAPTDSLESSKAQDSSGTQSKNAEQLYNKWKGQSKIITPAFCEKVVEVSKEINCEPDDLMAVMKSESGFDSKCTNGGVGTATGLFQFLECTFEDLRQFCPELKGLTRSKFLAMSPIEQLDVAAKFYKRAKKIAQMPEDKKLDAGTLYALNYLPARANNEVLARRGEAYYDWNVGLDINHDGKITKSELAARLDEKKKNKS